MQAKKITPNVITYSTAISAVAKAGQVCGTLCCSVLQRVAACCSVLQRVTACYSVLQRVAACCSVLQRVRLLHCYLCYYQRLASIGFFLGQNVGFFPDQKPLIDRIHTYLFQTLIYFKPEPCVYVCVAVCVCICVGICVHMCMCMYNIMLSEEPRILIKRALYSVSKEPYPLSKEPYMLR